MPARPAATSISTERLELQPLTLLDTEPLLALLSDPRLYVFTGGAPPTLPELQDRIARQVRSRAPDGREIWLNWPLRLRGNGQFIGTLQAGVRGTKADLAWLVGVPWQRRGYATEAALALVVWLAERGVARFEAKIHPDNAASQIVASRAGLAPTRRRAEGEVVWRQ